MSERVRTRLNQWLPRLMVTAVCLAFAWTGWVEADGDEAIPNSDVVVGLMVVGVMDDSPEAGEEKNAFCFSDEFLTRLQTDTTIDVAPRLARVDEKLDNLSAMTVVVMTGRGEFELTQEQVRLLRSFVADGGTILAGPSCADQPWAAAFCRMMVQLTGLEEGGLKPLSEDHVLFSILYELPRLRTVRANRRVTIQGVERDGRLAVVYSPAGLNDTAYADEDCCCCQGDEIRDSWRLTANVVAYVLTH